MKDSRYIELLNLYVDNQLTPEEAAELETEVQRSPERRKVYAQYCRMHKACTLLFEADRELAPKTAAVVVALRSGKVRGSDAESWSWLGWRGAGLAAAAALAVVVGARFVLSPVAAPQSELARAAVAREGVTTARMESSPAAGHRLEAAEMPSTFPSVGAQQPELKSVLFATAFRSNKEADWTAKRDASTELAWLNEVKMPLLRTPRVEDLQFEVRPASLSQPESPVFVGRRPFQGNLEMSAFQFQR